MTRNPKQRILTTMALSLVGAALAAGNANAERPDDRAGMLGVGAASAAAAPTVEPGTIPYLSHGIGVDHTQFSGQQQQSRDLTSVPDAFERAVARSTSTATRPDDRGSTRGPGVYFSVPPVPASVSADDFGWGDASAGAGAMLAAILLATGLAVSIRHRGRTILR